MFEKSRFPGKDQSFCLLLDYRIPSGDTHPDPRYRRPDETHEYELAAEPELASYLSGLFGEVDSPAAFLPTMSEDDMRRLLERHGALNEDCIATLYICDTGPGCGVTRVHSQSREFHFVGAEE